MSRRLFSPIAFCRKGLAIAFCAMLAGLFGACPGPDEFRRVPVPPVQLRVYPYGSDNTLGPVGNYKTFPSYGYGGIIVYHFTETEYLAFDLACPNDYEQGCKVTHYPADLNLRCEGCAGCTDCRNGCGTVFSLLTGFPEEGRYPNPLYQYQVQWHPSERTLLVYN
ncbi:MAG: hypothetical protein K2H70_01540 [Bacteroidales bacterium]|nr:hypothetical protein [Bacteroidales bacterium]